MTCLHIVQVIAYCPLLDTEPNPPFWTFFSKICNQNIPFWNQQNLQCNFLDRKWPPSSPPSESEVRTSKNIHILKDGRPLVSWQMNYVLTCLLRESEIVSLCCLSSSVCWCSFEADVFLPAILTDWLGPKMRQEVALGWCSITTNPLSCTSHNKQKIVKGQLLKNHKF